MAINYYGINHRKEKMSIFLLIGQSIYVIIIIMTALLNFRIEVKVIIIIEVKISNIRIPFISRIISESSGLKFRS